MSVDQATCDAWQVYGRELFRCQKDHGHDGRHLQHKLLGNGASWDVGRCAGHGRDPLRMDCRRNEVPTACPGCGEFACSRHTHAWWRGECPGKEKEPPPAPETTHALLHRAWTAAVGTLGYDKATWIALEVAVARAGRDADANWRCLKAAAELLEDVTTEAGCAIPGGPADVACISQDMPLDRMCRPCRANAIRDHVDATEAAVAGRIAKPEPPSVLQMLDDVDDALLAGAPSHLVSAWIDTALREEREGIAKMADKIADHWHNLTVVESTRGMDPLERAASVGAAAGIEGAMRALAEAIRARGRNTTPAGPSSGTAGA